MSEQTIILEDTISSYSAPNTAKGQNTFLNVLKRFVKSKPILSVIIGTLAAILGVGVAAYSAFNANVTGGSQVLSDANVTVAFGSAGSTNALSVGVTNMVPGDTIQRETTIQNTGTVAFGTANLFITVSGTTNALTTDATNGLQAEVEGCSVAWTSSTLSDGGYSYTCSGTTSTIIPSAAIGTYAAGVNLPAPIGTLAPSSSSSFVVVLTLPTTAGNTFQSLSTTLNYAITVTQPTAGNV